MTTPPNDSASSLFPRVSNAGRTARSSAPTGRGLKAIVWYVPITVVLAAVLLWGWSYQPSGPATEEGPLPIIASVPAFSLTASDGRGVTLEALHGRIWVADFIFTRCPSMCPQLTRQMQFLQKQLADRAGEVVLVSITVDPGYDTPTVLAQYAMNYKADPVNWWFLTGSDEEAVLTLVTKGFLQSVVPARGDDPLNHSNYLAVVDREGRIRAFHDGLDSACAQRVLHDVNRLLAEPGAV